MKKGETVFKIPMQSEISDLMKEKKGWPDKFCRYYAEKFWNYYNSVGWRIAGRSQMKSWQSAFYAQWQNLKFEEDIAMLQKCRANDASIPGKEKRGDVLNDWLNEYKRNWDKIPDEVLAKMYDYMKPLGEIKRLTPDELIRAKNHAERNGIPSGKALAVKLIFDRMIIYGNKFNTGA